MAQLLDDSGKLNKIRGAIMNAQDNKVISKEEAGFIVTLANKFRDDIERKTRALYALQGEISQLRTNEQVIVDIVNNLVSAQQRADDRQRTVNEIRKAKDEAKERKAREEAEAQGKAEAEQSDENTSESTEE